VLINAQLPDMTAHSLVGLIRRRDFKAPAIVFGRAASDTMVIQILDSGANDYVAEPYHLGVLLARLRAHIRQFERTEDAALRIGPYVLHPAQRRLVDARGERALVLTAREVEVLKYLYKNRGRVVDRMSLMRDVFGYRSDAETHTVAVHIYRIRRKMEFCAAHARIVCYSQGGYRLCAEEAHGRRDQVQPAAACSNEPTNCVAA
jgi:DNA-binding response OmpR family regulator